jgi:cyanate permease
MGVAIQWASIITTISLEMVIPGLIGYWLDQRCGIKALFVLLGFGGGMALALWHLLRVTKARESSSAEERSTTRRKP